MPIFSGPAPLPAAAAEPGRGQRGGAAALLQGHERLLRVLHGLPQGEQAHGRPLHPARPLHGRQRPQGVQQEDHAPHCQVHAQHQVQGKRVDF